MRYEDNSQSGSMQDQGPIARDDADQLPAGDRGPASGNVITGAGTESGAVGADAAADGAKIIAVAGAGGNDSSLANGRLQVEGEHGTLSLTPRGDYNYVANANVPENSRDSFTYTLADAAGASDQARLTIEIGKTQAVVDVNARRVVPGPDGVVVLPAGVQLSDVRIVGRDLLVMLPDGTQMLIVDGAVFIPRLVINDIEVPSTNLAALLIEQEPRPASGVPQSGGGNFIQAVGPLDPGIPLGDLLPPTQLSYSPPEFRDVGIAEEDRKPIVGANPLSLLDDDARPGGNAGGIGDDVDSANVSGVLSGSGGDGPLSFALSTAGAPTGFTYLAGPAGSLLVQQNGITVLTVTVNAQTGAYSIAQNAPISHAAGADENNILFSFGYTVTDRDGDVAAGSFQLNVDDDTPLIDVTAGADAAILLTTDDADTRGEATDSASSEANFSGVFNLAVNSVGADGLGTAGVMTFALGTPGGASGLLQGGVAINLFLVSGKVVGSTATSAAGVTTANTVFDVSLTGSNGVVRLTQYSQIDHLSTDPTPGGAGFNDHIVRLADNLVTLTANASISDRDGDSASDSATVSIGDNLRFTDDGPVLTGAQGGAGVTLDETTAVTPAGFPISATSASAVIVGSGLSFGADGAAATGSTSYAITLAGNGKTVLRTAQDDFPITLVQTSASVITGTYDGGKIAFTATINANGSLTVSQAVPLEHDVDGSTVAAYNDSLSLTGLINASITVRDFDGDTATASAPIGDRIVFLDDGPSIAIARSDDSNISIQTDDADTLGTASDSASASFAGLFTLTSAAGADGGTVSSVTYELGVGPTPAGLTSGGLAITLYSTEGGRVVGSTAQTGQQITVANTIFDVAVSSSGVVTVTQHGPIDHAAAADPSPGGAPFADQGYSFPDGAIVLNARATITDNDGDSASAVQSINIGANIRFTDDGPVARADTDALLAGTYGPETGNVLSGEGTTSGAAGADSTGADLPVQVVAIGQGEATDSSFDEAGNLVLGGLYGTLSIKADGSYSYVRNAGTPGGVSDSFTYTLRDRDGDTSQSTLTISIGNLPPLVNAPDADAPGTVVYEAALAGTPQGSGEEAAAGPNGDPREATTGTITFNQGDGPAAIRIDGVLVTGAGQVIDTGEGTIRIDTLGSGSLTYTYTLKDNLLNAGATSPDVISVTVTDKDGQVVSDTLTITIVDDAPVARLDSDTIASGTFGPATGNVISGVGTTNAAAGADTVGADGATVVGIKAGVDGAAFTGAVGTVIQGAYGQLTLGSNGEYSYTRTPGTSGGVTDRFSYTLRDGDGDTSVTQLEIVIEDAGVLVRIPAAGGDTTTVYERGLPERGGEPAGSGEIADGNGTDNDDMSEAVSGSIGFTAKDGLGSITLGGQALNLTGGYPQTITDTAGQKLVVTGVSYDPATGLGSIAYTYTLKDNRLVDPDSASFAVVITDADGDAAPAGSLVISIIDDVPVARADTDALAAGAYGPEAGNVISGVGTTSGLLGLDVVGADNATVVAVSGITSSSSFDANGNLQVNGQYGVLTIKADGSYSYARNAGTRGGVSDSFSYTLRDGDGDQASATLTISIADDRPELNAPDAGAPGTIVFEAGLPTRNGGEPEGSGEELAMGPDGDTREATSGTITYSDGDGPAIIRINNVVVSGTLGQVIDTGEGLLTITSFSTTTVGYSYLLKDNLLSAPESDTIPVSVEDADGDIVTDTLVISIVDDAPDAKLDTDALAAGTYGPETGNVISGAGTTSGLAGKDVVGADNAAVISVTGFGGSADSSFDGNGNLQVNGQYGVLTIKADGSYSYARNLNTQGGVNEVFNYTLRDGDGDQDSATLTIAIGDTPTSLTIPPAGGATTAVFEQGLPIRGIEQPGSGEIADGNGTNDSDPSERVSGTFNFEAKDGFQSVTIGGVVITQSTVLPLGVGQAGAPGALVITGLSYNATTGQGSVSYTFTLGDNVIGDQAVNGGNTDVSYSVVVRDLDDDMSTGNLVIRVVDDLNDAKADTDALVAGTYGPETGNVISGDGTTSGVAGRDVQGADGSSVVAVTGFGGSSDAIFDNLGNLQVNGQFGVLTIKADGSYSYLRNAGTPGGGTEIFTYSLRDGDGDLDTATLSIAIGNSPPTVNAPDAGAPGTLVFESGLPARGTESEGSAEQLAAGPNGATGETTSGIITYGAPDGPAVVRINGEIVTGTLGQVIDTGEGLLTITAFSLTQIGYSYTLKDNIAGNQSVNGGDTVDTVTVTVTDADLQVVSDNLVITIRDDAPLGNNDIDSIAAGTFGPAIGNVISGDGTFAPLLGKDVPGADGAVVTAVAPLSGTADTSFDANGNLEVTGLYGVLTIKADGSYSYARNVGSPGGVSDSFTYQLTDGDGDVATAVLRIDIADSPVTLDIPAAGGATTTVFEAGLPVRGIEPEGSGEAAAAGTNGDAREAVSGTIGFIAKDGLQSVSLGGVTLTGPYPQTIVNDAGQSLVVTALSYDAATGAGSISYTYVLKDNTLGLNTVNGGDTSASFALVVTDKDLDQSSGNLVITVKDDAPSAALDVDSVGNSNNPATGNVITAIDRLVGGDSNTSDGTADVPGADGAQVVRIASNNVALNIDVTPEAGNFVVLGQFGTLTIGQDGSYSYARSTTAPLTGTDVFTYTIRDGDGDEVSTTLTINIADAPVTSNIPPAGGLTTTVYEAALPARGLESEGSGEAAATGTDGDTREAVSGAIGFVARDGIGSISLGGVTLSGTYPQTITDTAGQKLVVNLVAFDPVTGIGSINYTYTLKDNRLVDPDSATFALVVTDSDGDTSGGNLVITIVDDVPTARADTDSVGEGATTGGNVILSTGTDNAPAGADTAGADGITVVGVRTGSNVATPASGNVATEISGTYGKLTLNADGSYSYKANNNSVTTAQTDVFTYTVQDGDGDLSTTILTITVNDVTLAPDVEVNSVNEAALDLVKDGADLAAGTATGSNSGSTAETTSGQLVIAGATSYVLTSPANGANGTLQLNSTTGAYTYTLTTPFSTNPAANDGPLTSGSNVFTYTATDANGNSVPGSITINIVDDVPTARDDLDRVVEGLGNSAVGNVVTGAGANPVSTDGADTRGADGAAVVGVRSGQDSDALPTYSGVVAGGVTIAGTYGNLLINPDGSYTYTLTAASVPVGASETFVYQLRDGDGDIDIAELNITIDQDLRLPTVTSPTGTVFEDGLLDGVQHGATSETTTGSFQVDLKGETGSVTIGGVAVVNGAVFNTGEGTLTITAVNTVGTVTTYSYSYTLLAPLTHSGAGEINPISDVVTVNVTDATGDSASGTINIGIVDDIPIAAPDSANVTEGAIITVPATGVLANDVFGADGPNGGVLGVKAGTAPGAPLTGVGTVIETTLGFLTLNANGGYTYESKDNSISANTTDVFTYTIRDADGDISTTTLTINLSAVTLAPDVEVNSVNEAALATGSNALSTAETTSGQLAVSGATVYTLTSPAAGANGTLQLTSSGAYTYTLTTPFSTNPAANDGAVVSGSNVFNYTATDANGNSVNGTITINIVDDVPTARDDSDTVTEGLGNIADGNLLTGSGGSDTNALDGTSDIAGADGGATVIGARTGTEAAGGSFTAVAAGSGGQLIIGTYGNLLIKADGSYTYTLTTASIPVGVTGESFSYQMRDADGDRDVAQLAISFVQDARLPTVTSPTGTVFEDGLADGVQHGATSETTTGSFQVDLKGETGSVTIGGVAVVNGAIFNTGEGTLTITSVSTSGTVTTYNYSYTLLAPLTHSGAGEINPISDVVTVNVTDATGDSASGTITIGIVDDIPVVTNSGTEGELIADETFLGVDPSVSFANAFNLNYGADGQAATGALVYALAVNAGPTGVVDTGTGQAVVLSVNASGQVEGRTATSGQIVFVVSVEANGSVTLDQRRAVVHNDPADAQESGASAVFLNADNLITLTATIKDGDGDTASSTLNIGRNISFLDDGPRITAAQNMNIQNSGDFAHTGQFAFVVGSDLNTPSNDDIKALTMSVVIGSATYVVTPTTGTETATSASYTFSFNYATNSSGGTALSSGTITFDKLNGNYTVDLNQAIQPFVTINSTSAATTFLGYNLTGAPTNSQPDVVNVQLRVDDLATVGNEALWVRLTGLAGSPGTSDGNTVLTAGEIITGGQSWVSASNQANGVGGDIVNTDEVLNVDLFTSNQFGNTTNIATASASAIYFKLDNIGNSEDFIVNLKLWSDTNNDGNVQVGETITRAVYVSNADIYKSGPGVTSGPGQYSGVALDNNDGLVIIESNDYNFGIENYQIIGAQIAASDQGLTGLAIDLNRAIQGSGALLDGASTFTGTIQQDSNNLGFKIQDIGFVSQTSTVQSATITLGVTVGDADGDTVTQTLVATVTSGADSVSAATISANLVTPVAMDMNGDGIVSYLGRDAGIAYDYNGDGIKEATAWVGSGDGILVRDADLNGTVSSAAEFVFGNADLTDLEALNVQYGAVLDSADADYAKFGVWTDADSDGVADAGEFASLTSLGISSIGLVSDGQASTAAGGQVSIAGVTTFVRSGVAYRAEDVSFAVGAVEGQRASAPAANSNLALAGLLAGFAGTAAAAQPAHFDGMHGFIVAGKVADPSMGWMNNAFDTALDGRLEVIRAEQEFGIARGNDELASPAQRFSNEEMRVEFEQGDALADAAMIRLDHGSDLAFGQSIPLPSGGELHIPDAAFFGAVVAQLEPQGHALVGSILADALAGGGDGGPGIDRLIDAAIQLAEPIQRFGGVEQMIEEAGGQSLHGDAMGFAATVPAWDAGHFSPLFGAGNTAMDSPALHPDAVQPAMNG